MKLIKEDLQTPLEEIRAKSYDWHFIGGMITTAIFTFLFYKYAEFPGLQPYIFSIAVNLLFWACKEMFWYTMYTFEGKYTWISKLRKYKLFQWSEPDWKDVRFSFYGSIPFVLFLRKM